MWGDILSAMGVFSTMARYHDKCGGYLEYCGGYLEYSGGYSVPWDALGGIL